jgi:DNA primase
MTLAKFKLYSERVKQLVNPEQALTRYVPGFKVHNGFALCFAHKEDTPSLKILPNHVYCYGCHFYGDVIAVTAAVLGISQAEALEQLNRDFRLALPIEGRVPLRAAQEAKEQRLKQANTETARERELRLFERKLDLEQQLFALEDIIEEYVPDDNIERPTDALWRWAVFAIRLVRFRLKYERYED